MVSGFYNIKELTLDFISGTVASKKTNINVTLWKSQCCSARADLEMRNVHQSILKSLYTSANDSSESFFRTLSLCSHCILELSVTECFANSVFLFFPLFSIAQIHCVFLRPTSNHCIFLKCWNPNLITWDPRYLPLYIWSIILCIPGAWWEPVCDS